MKTGELIDKVRDFCRERRAMGDEGWPPVTDEDMAALMEIVRGLIVAKFEEDVDGAFPVEATLVNRTTHGPLRYRAVPYSHKATTVEEDERVERAIGINMGIAYQDVDGWFKVRTVRRHVER